MKTAVFRDAYQAFDRRGSGWVELTPAKAAEQER
jgi:hypothetical protein